MRATVAAVGLLVMGVVLAGPAADAAWAKAPMNRGGGGRPSMPMARPAAPTARPQMSRPQMPAQRPQMQRPPQQMARPQMPQMQRPNLPVQRPNVATQRPGMNMQRPNAQVQNVQVPNFQRPSVGNMQRPNLARPSLPNAGIRPQPSMPSLQNRPTLGMGRPGMGAGTGGITRPTTLPGSVGRPGGMGPGSASRPGGGFANRPAPAPAPSLRPGQIGGATKPAFPQPGLQNRPGLGGDRPSIGGGNRPTTLPGSLATNRPGIGGNRPDIGGNWPGAGNRPGRPGIGGNRPGIGDGNNFWNNGNIGNSIGSGNNNFNNINVGGGWGYPGYGGGYNAGYGGDWANNWNTGYVNPHYGGWYNGCWNGNWGGGYNGGWWGPFALGAATWGLASTIGTWGLGYGGFGYGAMGYPGGAYVNPYYSGIPAAVVAASPYDYSQPVVVNNYNTTDGDLSSATDIDSGAATAAAAPENSEANRLFDEALAKFKAGDYAAALAGCDRAVKLSPKDSVIHEVRALSLFALGRYPEAAATLNAVLATAPGMDWTTLSGLYGSVDTYTSQLRKLEDFCRANPESAAGHFVLAYHYLVGGHADMASEALKVVVAKQPGDAVAKRLLEALTPPKEEAAPADKTPAEGTSAPAAEAGPETDLVGAWKASSGKDSVVLTITEDSKFTWKAMPNGRPPVELAGRIATARDAIALESEKSGTMTGKVVSKGPDAFDFSLAGAPADAKPIAFQRQK